MKRRKQSRNLRMTAVSISMSLVLSCLNPGNMAVFAGDETTEDVQTGSTDSTGYTAPVTQLSLIEVEGDAPDDSCSYGGDYSIYQGSEHRLNGGHLVETFVMKDTGSDSTRAAADRIPEDGSYTITFCADEPADMIPYVEEMNYRKIPLSEADCFTYEQKQQLSAIVPRGYPYVDAELFREQMKAAGTEISDHCGEQEMLAGMQAAIYCITNPRPDGSLWGYEYSDSSGDDWFSVANPEGILPGVSDTEEAETLLREGDETYLDTADRDVGAIRDYLLRQAGITNDGRDVVIRPAVQNAPRTPVIPKSPKKPKKSDAPEDEESEGDETERETQLYDISSLSIVPEPGANGTWKACVSGTLNQEVRENTANRRDTVTLELMVTDKKGNQVSKYGLVTCAVMPGQKDFFLEMDGIPEEQEITVSCTVKILDNELYVFYPDEKGREGWQIQIGVGGGNAYRKTMLRTASIPVKKIWSDAETEHPPVEVQLLRDGEPALNADGTAISCILSEQNGWMGRFAHVPKELWSYRSYIDAEMETNRITLQKYEYSVSEVLPEGYTAEVLSEDIAFPEEEELSELPAVGDQVLMFTAEGRMFLMGATAEVYGTEREILLSSPETGFELQTEKLDNGDIILRLPDEELWVWFRDTDGDGRINIDDFSEVDITESREEATPVFFARKLDSVPDTEGFTIINTWHPPEPPVQPDPEEPKTPEEPDPPKPEEPKTTPSDLPEPEPTPAVPADPGPKTTPSDLPDPEPSATPSELPETEPKDKPPAPPDLPGPGSPDRPEQKPAPLPPVSPAVPEEHPAEGPNFGREGGGSGGGGRSGSGGSSRPDRPAPDPGPSGDHMGVITLPDQQENRRGELAESRQVPTGDPMGMMFWGMLLILSGILGILVILV